MKGFSYCHDYHEGDPLYKRNSFVFGWDAEKQLYAIWTDDPTDFARAEIRLRELYKLNPTYQEIDK